MSVATDVLRDPYKGLAAFDATELDALLFFGREQETEIVVANALASRLTVLYGPAGVGKSSLLRAGVVQGLRSLPHDPAVAVAYFSTWAGDATLGLEAAARGALADAAGGDPGDAPGGLTDRLDAWTSALDCELCLVLDQLEEVFLYEGGLIEVLPELVTRTGLKVNVVLGIRDDQLARLDVFKAQIPALFSNYLRLDQLDRRAARAAILGPLERYNELAAEDDRVTIEPELVETVLSEVAAGRIQAGGPVDTDRIEAPYLQLVLQRLWDVERERRSSVLRASTLAELGGARQIVETHLERAMSTLTPVQQHVAAEMFGHLVTPSGSKIAHGVSDLATFARVDVGELEPVLSSLASERIIRPTGTNGHSGGLYEIYHDVLTDAVLNWRTRYESETALQEERAAARRRQRNLAAVAVVSLVALLAMAVLTVFAFSQRTTARREARRTRAAELLQQAQAQLAVDPVASIRAALRSAAITTSPNTESVLRSGLLAMNTELELHAPGSVTAGAYSPDGSSFALADDTGEVRLFRLADGKLLQTLQVGSRPNAIAFSPHGRFFASGSRDGRIRVWDLAASGMPAQTLAQGGPVTSVEYSHDGKLLLTAGGNSAKLWDASTGMVLRRLPHRRTVRSAAFNVDEKLILTVAHDPVARVWETATGNPVSELRQRGEITDADFGPNDLVVTGSRDGTGAVWYARTGVRKATLVGHTSEVLTVAFGPAGGLVATGSADGTTRVWRLDGGLADIQRSKRASIVSVNFSPDGQSLVSGSSDGSAMTSGFYQQTQYLYGQHGPMQAAFFSPDGLTVATISDSTARLWEPYGEPVLRKVHKGTGRATSVAFDPTGTMLASGGTDGHLLIEPAHGGPVIESVNIGSPITSVAWGRNRLLLVAAKSGTVHLFESGTGGVRPLRVFRHGSRLVGAALRADGLVAATAGTDGVVRLWNTETGAPMLRVLPAPNLSAVALDPTGRLLATADGRDVAVFNARTGRKLGLLQGHSKPVTGIAFSPDGTRLVSSSIDHDARLWDTQALRLRKVLHRHAAFVSGVAFSADGRWIATAGPAKAGVWQTSGTDLPGSFLFFVRGNAAPITSVAFSSRGDELATSARDGSIRVFDCHLCGDLSSLEAYARERLERLSG